MKIIFAGTPEFAVPALQLLLQSSHHIVAVYTQPDRPAGRGRTLHESPVKKLAKINSIPVFQPLSLREKTAQETLKSLNADLMVVAAYGLILPEVILTTPRFGCINIHPSLLPKFRGATPIQQAILAGDKETGVTIMQMAKGLDSGDILYTVTSSITPRDTTKTLHDRLANMGADALLHTISLIEKGAAILCPQDDTLATYAPKLTKENALLDFHQPAIALDRMIRAYNPFPVAYSYLEEQTVRIFDAEISDKQSHLPAGTIIDANKNGLDVATGDGVLRLTCLQLPGGKPLAVKILLHARAAMFAKGKQFQHA